MAKQFAVVRFAHDGDTLDEQIDVLGVFEDLDRCMTLIRESKREFCEGHFTHAETREIMPDLKAEWYGDVVPADPNNLEDYDRVWQELDLDGLFEYTIRPVEG